ncbi:LysR family transcriptional regulator [Acidithiobacillus thiooxidans]|uniref:HTH-type transcriptional activator CmpR n=1 Tax=Acidithiobacillus thiooxidans ATCC 19377 TaxID=637390 RepID=A0A543Q333_ACITH|nr:LysR family transcriptional regulator [Acidithiobacillus thiooxidans]MDX5935129.1 LysR family transcriptional regulator [Acidithiobacillus thiooxidans]TQN50739.1 HTH-type transcriptional activator CmpR [Acidithiobacillus thiooxidans ATCC 19377]
MADAEQLLTLLAVSESGSISAAAERLFRGQSSISERLKKLTEYVGEPLYRRDINGVNLTHTGEMLIPDIQRLKRAIRDIDSIIERRQRLHEGDLHIVATSLLANYYLPPYLDKFRELYHDINIYIRSGERYWNDSPIGKVDVFFYEGEVSPPDLPDYFETSPWQKNEIMVVTPLDHPLTKFKEITIDMLADFRIIWREPGSSIRNAIEKEFSRYGIMPQKFIEVSDLESVGIMVQTGLGIGFLNEIVLNTRKDWKISQIPLVNHNIITSNFMTAPHIRERSLVLSKFLEIVESDL